MQDSIRHLMIQKGMDWAASKASGSIDIVQPDSDKEYQLDNGRIITIFQTKAVSDGKPNISSFKCYLGGAPLRGYRTLSLEYIEITNGFSGDNPLYMLGVNIDQTVGNCITASSTNVLGGLSGNYSPSFMVPLSNNNEGGGIPAGQTGSWMSKWENQRSVPLIDVRTNVFDITLTDQNGQQLTWDGSTAVHVTIQMKAS